MTNNNYSVKVLSGKTVDELNGLLIMLKKRLFNLRCQAVLGEAIKDFSVFSKNKRDIARIKTELSLRKNIS